MQIDPAFQVLIALGITAAIAHRVGYVKGWREAKEDDTAESEETRG